MKLANNTPLAAKLTASAVYGPERFGMATAKATFAIDRHGRAQIDTQTPYPLFSHDEKTEFGLLPRDDLPGKGDKFEVILLGAAAAPDGVPATRATVSLCVGKNTRRLAVFGDRHWIETGNGKAFSAPVSFEKMPLTYENAFGGSCDVYLGEGSPVTVSDPLNPAGKGFDAGKIAQSISEQYYTAEGYPKFDKVRRLPNVEHPDRLVSDWEDCPEPACWATVPMDSGMHAMRSVDPSDFADGPGQNGKPLQLAPLPIKDSVFYRASPEWIVERPAPGEKIEMEGLRPEGTQCFRFPDLNVFLDYILGKREGTRELTPRTLVLLPEEKRFYVVYKYLFSFDYDRREKKSFRLRLA